MNLPVNSYLNFKLFLNGFKIKVPIIVVHIYFYTVKKIKTGTYCIQLYVKKRNELTSICFYTKITKPKIFDPIPRNRFISTSLMSGRYVNKYKYLCVLYEFNKNVKFLSF